MWRRSDVLIILALVILGLLWRLFPGKDHFLWNNSDYGRDVYEMRAMVANKDLKLLGPKASVFDRQQQAYLVFNGPLYYYLMAPFYFLAKGDPNLPLLANILIHLSTLIPIGWLGWRIFKNKAAVFLLLFLSAVSYELIEYSRWLLNPAMALPFLAWFFLALHFLYAERRTGWAVGLALGLAVQNQIFLLYWLLPVAIILIAKKIPLKQWLQFAAGLSLGLAPLIIAEIKFQGRASWSLLNYVLETHPDSLSWPAKIDRYLTHLNIVSHHQFWGFSNQGGWLLVGMLLLIPIINYRHLSARIRSSLPLLYLLFFSHAVIFAFHFYESIYADLGLGLIMLIFLTINLIWLWSIRWKWLSLIIIFILAFSQLRLLITNTQAGTPFGRHFFLDSDTLLFSERMVVVAKLYELSQGQPFSISILDTPYGWPAVWAVNFEQYQARYQVELPKWYGFHVNGVPGDRVFQPVDAPLPLHFVLKQKIPVVDEGAQQTFATQQDQVTQLEQTLELNNMIIEQRRRLN